MNRRRYSGSVTGWIIRGIGFLQGQAVSRFQSVQAGCGTHSANPSRYWWLVPQGKVTEV